MTNAELFGAIQKGDAVHAEKLIRAQPGLASERNENGVSALMAARYSNLKGVVELIRSTISELDIFEAATIGELARLRELLDRSPATVNSRSADGGTALHFACFFAQVECARELINRGADLHAVAAAFGNVQPLHSAAAGRSVAIVRMLLEAGADPNAKQTQGWTALHSAAQHGDLEMSQTLVQFGAQAAATAENGQSPLDLAKAGGHTAVFSELARPE